MPRTSTRLPKALRQYQNSESERIAQMRNFTRDINKMLDEIRDLGNKPITYDHATKPTPTREDRCH